MFDVRHQQYLNSHMCDFFCVENEKKFLFSPSLSLSLPPFSLLYLMWSPVVKMFFSAWFAWIEIPSTISFSFSISLLFAVFCIISHQPIYLYRKTNHQENHSYNHINNSKVWKLNWLWQQKSSFDVWMIYQRSIYFKINFHVLTIHI